MTTEKRIELTTEIFKYGTLIKTKMETLLLLLSITTDKELIKFHKEFIKK